MKLFVTLICLVATTPTSISASYLPALNDYLHEYEYGCGKEIGLYSAEIEKIRENGRLTPLPVGNESVNQWAKCMLQKFQILNNDGTVNTAVDRFIVWDDTNTYRSAFPICTNKIGKDTADTARLMWDCYRSNSTMVMMAWTSCHNC